MRTDRILDSVVLVFIFAAGLGAAYVCFGVLKSDATGKLAEYSVGGAIAGALVSWGVLTSVYLQLRGSSGELHEARERAKQLEHKLIRGAPRPRGFEIEVDERQRIVLARPKDWQAKGGTIFELETRGDGIQSEDTFAAVFHCYFVPIDKASTPGREKYYEAQLKVLRESSALVHSSSHEIVQLGGELAGVESLKMIANQFVRATIMRSSETGRTERSWTVVSRDEAAGRILAVLPPRLIAGRPGVVRLFGFGLREGAVAYVNGQKREARVLAEREVQVRLTAEDLESPGVIEFAVENAGVGGMRSNTSTAIIERASEGESTPEGAPLPDFSDGSEGMPGAGAPAPAPGEVAEQPRVVVQEVVRMRVICYHEALERIYYFDFLDDVKDFRTSSAVFNRVLASTRFLD
jgi:hypothetical protein